MEADDKCLCGVVYIKPAIRFTCRSDKTEVKMHFQDLERRAIVVLHIVVEVKMCASWPHSPQKRRRRERLPGECQRPH